MKELGGYFELDCAGKEFLHKNGIWLNSGRNALRYILRAYKIKKIVVPYFTCPVVWDAIHDEGCEIEFYEVGRDLLPKRTFPKEAYFLYNNYFGVCDNKVRELASVYPNLIVDNAQALYAQPCGLASFYSPRKFFGLPDGGIAVCSERIELPEERDVSFTRMSHLLKRIDIASASAGYEDFKINEASLEHAPVLKMSRLTEALMGNLDVNIAKQRRLVNVKRLHEVLHSPWVEQRTEDDVPLVYPLYTERASGLRQRLIANKVYVATYWPGVEQNVALRDNVLALPCDQRLTSEDIARIVSIFED